MLKLILLFVLLELINNSVSFMNNLLLKRQQNFKLYCMNEEITKSSSDKGEVLLAGTVKESLITRNFITNRIDDDLANNRNNGIVLTRFPPEPNGYLHLGHAKSVHFNFGVAKAYNGLTNLRFDDTNPEKEETEYVQSIMDDVKWMISGTTMNDKTQIPPWTNGNALHASDYFDTIYESAKYLLENGRAYIDELSPEEVREYRGTLKTPGKNSPYRERSIEENVEIFEKMKQGVFPDGKYIVRAKIDMESPNLNLRDPTIYRIKHASHPITGDKWCIYPMYDFAHSLSDAIEGITHSICTLEFADHRPLYDWIIDNVLPSGLLEECSENRRPRQIEFSRLNLQYTVLSKRKLIQLVKDNVVDGWNDPRMPTISGIRRRGIPSSALKLFCERIAISKADQNIDIALLEDCTREILDGSAPRAFAVLNPLLVTIKNWPEDEKEDFDIDSHPKKSEMGTRSINFEKQIYIDREDFFDGAKPPKGFKRLVPGGLVRLRSAYVIQCNEVIRSENGEVKELICTYDERTKSGNTPEGMKRVKGIIQWVPVNNGIPAEIRMYDRLFNAEVPGKDHEDGNFLKDLNPDSLEIIKNAIVEPSLLNCSPGSVYQFERIGYFCVDTIDNSDAWNANNGILKLNRIVTLKDNWSSKTKEQDKQKQQQKKGGGQSNLQVVEEDIRRIDFRVGRIVSVEKHPDADSLLVEKIDCGDTEGPRTIISGLAKHYEPEDLINKNVVVVCNLKPTKMRGIMSEGMVLCAYKKNEEIDGEIVKVINPPKGSSPGDIIKTEGYDDPKPDVVLKSKTAQECWKRVASQLGTNNAGEVFYKLLGDNKECRLGFGGDGGFISCVELTNSEVG